MNVLSCVSSIVLLLSTCFISSSHANNTLAELSVSEKGAELVPSGAIFTAEMRWTIKREVMSTPGVMLDMADMTDNGYVWTDDVVWVGSGLPANENWYIAGFMFERPNYKSVWLQYTFTLSKLSGRIANFKQLYGRVPFR